ncbi:MAG TPA: universal stress protein [Chloroflexota bacterium]|nr:universal stress protein [Chloroflexota bacterium]
MHTIIVPLDGSPLAEQALLPARTLAANAQARLVLVRAVPFVLASHRTEAAGHAALTEAQEYLHGMSRQLEDEGLAVRSDLLPGGPAQAILFAAQAHHADLIAMSTHGSSGIQQAFLGSVADSVLRHSECPVLLARASSTPLTPAAPRRILVPLDGSPLSEAALAYLTSEHLADSAKVFLLRVISLPALSGVPMLSPSATADLFTRIDEETNEERKEAEAYLTSLGERYLHGHQWETRVVRGYASEEIVRQAGALEATLITMATAGRHGFERLLYGSVAGRVLRQAPMPVLLVHNVAPNEPRHT